MNLEALLRQVRKSHFASNTLAQLVDRTREGDADAFVEVIFRLYPDVVKTIRKYLEAHEPIEDIAADVFAVFWANRSDIDSAIAEGWVHRTARNLAGKYIEATIVERKNWGEVARRMPFSDSADRQPESTEIIQLIQRTIAELPSDQRAVLHAAGTFESDADAAKSLDLNVATYRTQLYRVRQRMRQLLLRAGVAPLLTFLCTMTNLFGCVWRLMLGKVLMIGLIGGGVGWWYWPSAVPPVATSPIVTVRVPTRKLEFIEDLRFRSEIIPEMLEHLKKAMLGNAGMVKLLSANRNATRYEVLFECIHRENADGKVVLSKTMELRFRMHIATRAIRIESFETGQPVRRLNPSDTIVLGPTNLFGITLGKPKDVAWPGLLEATRAIQKLGVQNDVAIHDEIHDLRRTMFGRDATPDELVQLTSDLRDRGWLLRSHAEWSTGSPEFLDRFIRPYPPRQAARNYLEKLYVTGSFTERQVDEIEKLFVIGPDGKTEYGPPSDYVTKLKPRSRWAEVSLED